MDKEKILKEIVELSAAQTRLEMKAESEGRGLTRDEEVLRAEMTGTINEMKKSLPEKALSMEGFKFAGQSRGYDKNILMFQDSEGKSISAFSNQKRFSDLNKGEQIEGIGPGSLGKILRSRILGDPMGLNPAEFRALSESIGSGGGWMVSPQLSSYVIDLARNKSCVLLAGGWSLPMLTEELTICKILSDPTSYWTKEGSKITESEGTFAPLKLRAMVVGCLCRVSRALLEDSPTAAQTIESQIGFSLGTEIDRCCLLGNGVNEPKGLLHCSDINSYSLGANGAALTNYDPFSYACQYIQEDNSQAGAVIMAPRTYGSLDRLKEGTTLAPLAPPPSYQALLKFVTNQIPVNQVKGTSSVASSAFVGDFKNVVLGLRKSLTIDVAASGVGSGSVDVFSSIEVLIRGFLRLDVALLRENAFTWISGIL